jgi:hypothetical protein
LWPSRAEAILKFGAGKLPFRVSLRRKLGARGDRPLVAELSQSRPGQ